MGSVRILRGRPVYLWGGVNSTMTIDADMRQKVQVMAYRLFGAKTLPEPKVTYCQPDPSEQSSMKLESNDIIFIQER